MLEDGGVLNRILKIAWQLSLLCPEAPELVEVFARQPRPLAWGWGPELAGEVTNSSSTAGGEPQATTSHPQSGPRSRGFEQGPHSLHFILPSCVPHSYGKEAGEGEADLDHK